MTNKLNPERQPAAQVLAPTDPRPDIDFEITVLDIDQIDCYEHNPRLLRNPKWLDIKAYIRASHGLTEPLSVTRRPRTNSRACTDPRRTGQNRPSEERPEADRKRDDQPNAVAHPNSAKDPIAGPFGDPMTSKTPP